MKPCRAVAHTKSPECTYALGRACGEQVTTGDVLVLVGDLAAGKTLFVKGLAAGIGADPDEVHSPTFSLLHTYQGRLTLHHFDLYRLDDADEINRLGFDEYLEDSSGVVAVEWGNKFPDYMPHKAVWITFTTANSTAERLIEFTASETNNTFTQMVAACRNAAMLAVVSNAKGGPV